MLKILLSLFISILSVFPLSAYANEMTELQQIIAQAKQSQQAADNPLPGTDPYEPFNRTMFDFNMAFHRHIGAPVAHAYLDYVPQPVQTGLSNFFDNLKTPIRALNSFLQGKGQEGLEGVMRFSMNTVFGLGGLIDIATPAGLNPEHEDFGQTLYVWGVWPESHYLVLPILGPYTTRSLLGDASDGVMDPVYQTNMVQTDAQGRTELTLGDDFVTYTKATPLLDQLKNQPDPYIFARESYFQYRKNQLYDGHPPVESLDDFDFE